MNTPNNKNKYVKGTPEWEKRIIGLVGKEIDQEFKKGQKKPDGTEVTADKETIKVNDVKQLLEVELPALKKIMDDKFKEVEKGGGYKAGAAKLFKRMSDLKDKIDEWKDATSKKSKTNYTDAYANFLGKGDGTTTNTSYYGSTNKGWIDTETDYINRKWKDKNNADQDYSNLYQGTIRMGTISQNNHTRLEITEQEYIKIITRTIKLLESIDEGKFDTYLNDSTKGGKRIAELNTNGDYPATDFNANNIKQWLKDLKAIAKNLKDNKIKGKIEEEIDGKKTGKLIDHPDQGKLSKGVKRLEYTFSGNITANDLKKFYNLMKLFGDYSFVSHDDFKKCLPTLQEETLIILPVQKGSDGKPKPMSKSELDNWKIKNDDKTKYYNTDYGTQISSTQKDKSAQSEYAWDSKIEVKVEADIKDWANLINTFVSEQVGDENNKYKLLSSFTDDPIRQLFADYVAGYNETSETFGGGKFTFWKFPERLSDIEFEYHSLKGERDVLLKKVNEGSEELVKAETEYEAAKKEIRDKKVELDNKITAKITELRQELKEKYKVSDTETNDFTGDNKITTDEHFNFRRLVENIRFLVNNDDQKPTGKTNEDQACQSSQEIVLQALSIWRQASWDGIGWQPGADEKVNRQRTDEERIAVIKENKDGKYTGRGLNWWHDSLIELEKLVKLSDRETEIKTALKKAIDHQTPEENAKDWQNNLKAIEIGLETAFTEAKIKKWKEKKDGQSAFNTITSVNSLLKKVCQDGKVNEDFLTFLKGKDTELASLEKLIEKKEPKEVILLIHQWEYNKLDDPKKAERHLKYAWSELGGKQKVDEYKLTDEDKKAGGNFEKFLYECAIGKINYSSLKKPTEQENSNDNSEGQNPQWWEKGFYWPIWTSALAIIGGLIAWWKRTDWFGGKKEEEEGETELEKETSEDEE